MANSFTDATAVSGGTITAASVLSRAREIIQDPAGSRWESTKLLTYLNDAMRHLALWRPELTQDANGALTAVVDVDEEADATVFAETERETLARYVASRAYSVDDPDKQNLESAAANMAEYRRLAGLSING